MRTEEQKGKLSRFYFSRRDFLKAVSALAAYCAAPISKQALQKKSLQPRAGKGNLFVEDGKPLLVVVSGNDARAMLAKGMQVIGGMGRIVKSGDSTFIKPNYGSHRAFPTGSDPYCLIAISDYLKAGGAGKVTICDSSDAYVLNKYNDYAFVFKANDVFRIAERAGVEVKCTHPTDEEEYVTVYSDRWEKNPEIKVNKYLLGAAVIINQPMLKKHDEAGMTCALKNFFGAVYQPQRMAAHKQLKEGGEQGKDFFAKTTAEFADSMRPELTIVDARRVLTVKGPSFKGGSVVKAVDKLIISGDMVATDSYCAQILEAEDTTFKKEMIVPTLQYAEKLGLGTADLSKVKVVEVSV
jgi:uncharacterized protein (DUF362 family)